MHLKTHVLDICSKTKRFPTWLRQGLQWSGQYSCSIILTTPPTHRSLFVLMMSANMEKPTVKRFLSKSLLSVVWCIGDVLVLNALCNLKYLATSKTTWTVLYKYSHKIIFLDTHTLLVLLFSYYFSFHSQHYIIIQNLKFKKWQ